MFVFLFMLLISSIVFAQPSNSFVHGPNFNLECNLCHGTNSWQVKQSVLFDHNSTGFSLLGAHREVDCMNCHTSLVFSQIGHRCIDCHQDVHQGAFGINCENCHTPTTWENKAQVFEQHQNTRFPLMGVHALLDCQACHADGAAKQDFKLKSTECKSCHLSVFMSTLNPSHREAGFSLQCENCHLLNASTWKQAVFEHTPNFPLTGGHANLECKQCHTDRYKGQIVDCYGCHQTQYEGTSDPDHQAFGFPTNCQECHSTMDWRRERFDHLGVSGFALVGAHTQVQCIACHVNNQLRGLPRDCFGCHQATFEQTRNPNHVTANFPHECLTCHNQNAWSPAAFDHSQTNFPLTGAHSGVLCESCHQNNQYSGTPSDCYACHQSQFEQTTDPNHQQANFSHDCTTCHSTSAWKPATFDHNQTNFPLTGAHKNVSCIDCHGQGYSNTAQECVSCHQQNYDQTTNPDHKAANFPVTCEDCHTTNAWQPANWDHDAQYFPIYSGSHKEAWSVCSDCHVNNADFSQFECINCHEHNRTKMDDKHKEVTNYVYQSNACYNCHPQGKGD